VIEHLTSYFSFRKNDVEERVANQRGIISNKLTRPPDISTKSLSRLHRSLWKKKPAIALP